MISITRKSTLTGKERTKQLPITQEQLDMYEAGVYHGAAFPGSSEEDIRFIRSGITAPEHEAFVKAEAENRGKGCGAC
tara:strand:+ start:1690 stop:1923 length:234 start_codon:yes stop_codon:yes gene_type:complete